MGFKQIQKRLKTLDLKRETEAIVNSKPTAVTELNKKQLEYGYASDGEILGLYRSVAYALYKESLGSKAGFGVVNLKNKEDYYKSFQAKASSGQLSIYNTDRKAAKLAGQYGADRIMGLNEESRTEYRKETLKPELSKRIRQKLFS